MEKVAVVTGTSSGIGFETALALAREGYYTYATMRDTTKSDKIKELGKNKYDVVIDLVAGDNWNQLIEILKPGGRYATSGAIAGPIVKLDLRTLYLKDLTLYGCTFQSKEIFRNIIKYIE